MVGVEEPRSEVELKITKACISTAVFMRTTSKVKDNYC